MLEDGVILTNIQVAKDIFQMKILSPGISKVSKPGQFVNLKISDKLDPLLRRPISFHEINAEEGTFTMLYLVVGEGTRMMSTMTAGEKINVLGPLGNGFNMEFKGQNAVLVGGGIGVAPLYPLAERLIKNGKHVHLIVGAKNKDYLTDTAKYEKIGAEISITTDDGSYGMHGFVTQVLSEIIDAGKCDYIYACGPTPMLKFVEKIALEKHIPGQVSTESHMGCGLGVCLLCPNKMKAGGYKRTCTDGPVFSIGEIDYE